MAVASGHEHEQGQSKWKSVAMGVAYQIKSKQWGKARDREREGGGVRG